MQPEERVVGVLVDIAIDVSQTTGLAWSSPVQNTLAKGWDPNVLRCFNALRDTPGGAEFLKQMSLQVILKYLTELTMIIDDGRAVNGTSIVLHAKGEPCPQRSILNDMFIGLCDERGFL